MTDDPNGEDERIDPDLLDAHVTVEGSREAFGQERLDKGGQAEKGEDGEGRKNCG